MSLFPRSAIGRRLAAAWFSAAIGLLLFAWVQRDVPDMPQLFTWGLIALSFPVGLPVGAGVGLLMLQAYRHLGLPYQPFLDLLPSWLLMLGFGYLQWFLLLPALWRRLRRAA